MALITEHSEPKKRRTLWWVPALALVGLSPAALFGWSLFTPLIIPLGDGQKLALGRVDYIPSPRLQRKTNRWIWSVELPGEGAYLVGWSRL
jgi:hypothetical protein